MHHRFALKPRFFSIRRTLALLLCGMVWACGHADTIKKSAIPPVKIIDVTLAKGVREAGGTSLPVEPVGSYTTTDEAVFAHITLAHLTGSHSLRWEWFDPSGNLYESSGDTPLAIRKGAYVKAGTACHALKLDQSRAADFPGEWRMRLYLDDSLAAVEKFTLAPAPEDLIGEDLSAIDFGRYHALVIGNDAYRELPRLKCAANDAATVGRVLAEDYGYAVTVKRDATRAEIVLALDDLRRSLTRKDNLLIYYAGHGWLDKDADEGYWLPVDAARENSLNWISSSQITAAIKAMDAKHVLIVADSCYAGKLARDVRGLGVKKLHGYYKSIVKRRVRSVLCSGGLEPVTDSGGSGDHSVFAAAFIEALKNNEIIIDGTALFSRLRRPVMLNADQTPEYSDIRKAGHESGDFVFVRDHILAQHQKQEE